MLNKYLVLNRYIIPLFEVDSIVSNAIIKAIKGRFVLTMTVQQDGTQCYVLEPLKSEGAYNMVSKEWASMLSDYFKSCRCPFFYEVSLKEYSESELYQKSIDKVLILANNRQHNGYSLGLKSRGRNLIFVEYRSL